jgi:hypothetical protein
LDSALIAIGGCDTVPQSALGLISVALIKEQLGRFVVLTPSLVIPDSLLRAKVESEKQLRNGIYYALSTLNHTYSRDVLKGALTAPAAALV